MDATWNIFNGKLPLGFVFRYYGDDHRGIDGDWHIFSDELLIKNATKLKFGSNPEVDLKIKSLDFISRELEDDNDGDFEVNFDDNTFLYIIISLVGILIISGIIGLAIYLKKKKEKNRNRNNSDLKISLSIN